MYGPTGGGKKFATNFHITFSAEFSRPPHPRFQCWYFEAREHNFLHQGGKFDWKKVRNQNPCCALPTLKSGGAGVSLVTEAYISIVSMVWGLTPSLRVCELFSFSCLAARFICKIYQKHLYELCEALENLLSARTLFQLNLPNISFAKYNAGPAALKDLHALHWNA